MQKGRVLVFPGVEVRQGQLDYAVLVSVRGSESEYSIAGLGDKKEYERLAAILEGIADQLRKSRD